MEFKSINPYTGQEVARYKGIDSKALERKLTKANIAFNEWKHVSFSTRSKLMLNVASILRENIEEYAKMITIEMGKPISESRAEIKKCAWVCEYYAENAERFLEDEIIETDAQKSFVRNAPIGAILAIMPWNFPFWQVFRFAAPTLMAGNTALLKHAPNVFGCADHIEAIFTKAGFPEGVFQNLILHHDQTEQIIAHSSVQAVTLTGSEAAGSSVAAIAGKYIKKSVLELGGNNAFIVLDDANIDQAVQTAIVARMLNCGQSCIAAKRFILMEGIYDQFVSKFQIALENLKIGDPLDDDTQIGPLARMDLAENLQRQIRTSIQQGAELLYGGKQNGCFHEPTILTNIRPGMPAFDEETFGPLASMIKVGSEREAIRLSEQSRFGLGLTVCTTNIEKALELSSEVSDGAFFINELVKSDPRLPFGGTKYSGYGRELAKDGIFEFVNRKTIFIK